MKEIVASKSRKWNKHETNLATMQKLIGFIHYATIYKANTSTNKQQNLSKQSKKTPSILMQLSLKKLTKQIIKWWSSPIPNLRWNYNVQIPHNLYYMFLWQYIHLYICTCSLFRVKCLLCNVTSKMTHVQNTDTTNENVPYTTPI